MQADARSMLGLLLWLSLVYEQLRLGQQTGIARTGRLLATCGDCSCTDKHCSETPEVRETTEM